MPTRLPWPLVFQVLGVIGAVWLVIRTWHVWLAREEAPGAIE